MIHPSAFVDPKAEVGEGCSIGPYALIQAGAVVGHGCTIGPFAQVRQGAILEAGVVLDAGVVVGGDPQDLKYRGETTGVRIGTGTRLREYVTVNRGTGQNGETLIGRQCLVMAYAHVAHDCRLGDGVIVANGVQMGGHVRLGRGAVISGMTGLHQFVCIGAGAFIGGNLRVDKDVLPGLKALGDPLRWGGLNPIGWERLGYPRRALATIERFYRALRQDGVDQWRNLWSRTIQAGGLDWETGVELEKEFEAWVEKDNLFCSTLVDRIVTGYPRAEAPRYVSRPGRWWL